LAARDVLGLTSGTDSGGRRLVTRSEIELRGWRSSASGWVARHGVRRTERKPLGGCWFDRSRLRDSEAVAAVLAEAQFIRIVGAAAVAPTHGPKRNSAGRGASSAQRRPRQIRPSEPRTTSVAAGRAAPG
jgi:hypothetical protein